MFTVFKTIFSIRYKAYNSILFHIKAVKHKNFPHIKGYLILKGQGKLEFGKNVSINSGEHFNPIGGDKRMIFVIKKNANLTIGNNVGMSNSAIVCHNKIIIEENVKLGGGVKIYDTDFHTLNYHNRRKKATDIGNTKPVLIKKDAFIGAHSIILKGVTIGDKAIIGAGSVVTKDIPSNEVWAGNPAKYIKKLTY